jgi:hypothetical protein
MIFFGFDVQGSKVHDMYHVHSRVKRGTYFIIKGVWVPSVVRDACVHNMYM